MRSTLRIRCEYALASIGMISCAAFAHGSVLPSPRIAGPVQLQLWSCRHGLAVRIGGLCWHFPTLFESFSTFICRLLKLTFNIFASKPTP